MSSVGEEQKAEEVPIPAEAATEMASEENAPEVEEVPEATAAPVAVTVEEVEPVDQNGGTGGNTAKAANDFFTAAQVEEPALNPLDKSYESMGSEEIEEPHYNIESDGEPPQDEVGDTLTVIHKRQVVKQILEVGENLGKPGRPFIVTV